MRLPGGMHAGSYEAGLDGEFGNWIATVIGR